MKRNRNPLSIEGNTNGGGVKTKHKPKNNNTMTNFNQLDVGDRFLHNFVYWEKKSSLSAMLVSDEKYEQGRAKFIPMFSNVGSFDELTKVEKISEPLLVDKYLEENNGNPVRFDWPASKHPG